MKSPVTDFLQQVLDETEIGSDEGHRADYIPPLATADPTTFALCLTMTDGQQYLAGDHGVEFTIQSIAKPFAYALALQETGIDQLLERVGVEPTGEAFNELSLEQGSKRPLNPMINAGALVVHSCIGEPEAPADERARRVVEFMSACAGRELAIDTDVYEQEIGTADRNLAIAHMLRSYHQLDVPAEVVVRGYTLQCSANVTTADLTVMAATLANGGENPITKQQVIDPEVVHLTLSVMLACGMYDDAGDWMVGVGIPAKSGVSGGILGVMPGQYGVATFAPPLDSYGNSVRGVDVFQRLSRQMGMHLLDAQAMTRSVLRDAHPVVLPSGNPAYLYALQGPLRFSSMEQVIRRIEADAPTERDLVIDTSLVTSIDHTALRMLRRVLDEAVAQGHTVWTVPLGSGISLTAPGIREIDSLDAFLGRLPTQMAATRLLPEREYEHEGLSSTDDEPFNPNHD